MVIFQSFTYIVVHYALVPLTPLSWGLGVQGWSRKECKAFTMPLGRSFSWSFSQVNKFMSLLSPSFSHFLHCCVWSSPSHLLALLCVVVLFPPPPFHGGWVCKDGVARNVKHLQHHEIDCAHGFLLFTSLSLPFFGHFSC